MTVQWADNMCCYLAPRRNRQAHCCEPKPDRARERARFFTPRLRFKTLDELNAWLLDKCIAHAKAHRHPELSEQTVWEVFEAERPKLVPYAV